jgi:hypothetical protein
MTARKEEIATTKTQRAQRRVFADRGIFLTPSNSIVGQGGDSSAVPSE